MVKRKAKTQDEAMGEAFVAGTLPEEDRRAPDDVGEGDETGAGTPAPTGASQGSGPIGADVGTPAPIQPIESVMREITVEDIADVVDVIALTVGNSNPQPVQVHADIPASPNHLVMGREPSEK